MKIPNEITIHIVQYCDWNSLLKLRGTCKLLEQITYPIILTQFNKKILKNDKQCKISKRDFEDFNMFLSGESERYKSFIQCNISDINEASWYCKPFEELHLVCFLVTLLYGNENYDWYTIRNTMKKISFKNWYKSLKSSHVIQIDKKTLEYLTSKLCSLSEDFIPNLKRKSTVGHIIYINVFSILQLNLLRNELYDLEITLTHFYNLKNNLMKFGNSFINKQMSLQ